MSNIFLIKNPSPLFFYLYIHPNKEVNTIKESYIGYLRYIRETSKGKIMQTYNQLSDASFDTYPNVFIS